MARYAKMLHTSKSIYEYITKGKKIKEGKTLKAQIDQDNQVKDGRPPWRSTGVSTMPSWNKPSKYQLNCNVKAKVFTGLGSHGSNHNTNKEGSCVGNSQESHTNLEQFNDNEFTQDKPAS